MKLKILKLFAVMFTVQGLWCPSWEPKQEIKPNTPICTLNEALDCGSIHHTYTDEEHKKSYKNFIKTQCNAFRLEWEDWASTQSLKRNISTQSPIPGIDDFNVFQKILEYLCPKSSQHSPSFQLSSLFNQLYGKDHNRKWSPRDFIGHLYMGLANHLDFIQGQDEKIYLPTVMLNGTIQMIESDMQFEYKVDNKPDGSKEIIGIIWKDKKSVKLAESHTIINSDGLCSKPTTFVWLGHRVTQSIMNQQGVSSQQDSQGRFVFFTQQNFQSLPSQISESLIQQSDEVLRLEGSDPTDKYGYSHKIHEFPARHIIAYQLSAFALICQSGLENGIVHSKCGTTGSRHPFGSELTDIMLFKNIEQLLNDMGHQSGYGPCIPGEYSIEISDITSTGQIPTS